MTTKLRALQIGIASGSRKAWNWTGISWAGCGISWSLYNPRDDVKIMGFFPFYVADDLWLLDVSSSEGKTLRELPWKGSSGGCWSSPSEDSETYKQEKLKTVARNLRTSVWLKLCSISEEKRNVPKRDLMDGLLVFTVFFFSSAVRKGINCSATRTLAEVYS